jgi:hypothetical protein
MKFSKVVSSGEKVLKDYKQHDILFINLSIIFKNYSLEIKLIGISVD